MAVDATLLTGASSTTDAISFVTASITPSASKLVCVAVSSRASGAAVDLVDPTLSGNGLTYVKIGSQHLSVSGASPQNLTLFRAMGASPSAGAITIDFGAQTQQNIGWIVAEFGGVVTTGSHGEGAVLQPTFNIGTGTSLTVTLAAFGSADNATLGAFSHITNEGAMAGTGFTEITETQRTEGFGCVLSMEFRVDNDTSVDTSWATSAENIGFAMELVAAAVGHPMIARWRGIPGMRYW